MKTPLKVLLVLIIHRFCVSEAYSWKDFGSAVKLAYSNAANYTSSLVGRLGTAMGRAYVTVQDKLQDLVDEISTDTYAAYLVYQETHYIYPNASKVRFYLYTDPLNSSNRAEMIYNNVDSITKSGYNSKLPIILIAHGFMGNTTSPTGSATYLKMGYFNAGYVGRKGNIVLVDWSLMSGPKEVSSLPGYLGLLPAYVQAASNVYIAAQRVSQFLLFLASNGLVPNRGEGMHLVGHSLGAHVLGMAAYYYKNVTGDAIGRVTGTDPAGPLFQGIDPSKRFDRTHAKFVDAIHTNQYEFGYVNSLGDVDFYVNGGGRVQPQCEDDSSDEEVFVGCSHNMAPQFFALSLTGKTIQGTCYSSERTGSCNAKSAVFGEFCTATTSGPYLVQITENTN